MIRAWNCNIFQIRSLILQYFRLYGCYIIGLTILSKRKITVIVLESLRTWAIYSWNNLWGFVLELLFWHFCCFNNIEFSFTCLKLMTTTTFATMTSNANPTNRKNQTNESTEWSSYNSIGPLTLSHTYRLTFTLSRATLPSARTPSSSPATTTPASSSTSASLTRDTGKD